MTSTAERQRHFEAAAPGGAVRVGWDRILQRDYARLDLEGTRTVKFAYLYANQLVVDGGKAFHETDGGLTLALYVGDTLEQARAFYNDRRRVHGLLGLRDVGWELRPNFHFGSYEKGFCWTSSAVDVDSYGAYWVDRIDALSAYPRADWNAEIARLIADGIFSADDERQFDADFRETSRPNATPRPTVGAFRSWNRDEVRDIAFPREPGSRLRQILAVLQEPWSSSAAPPAESPSTV